LSFNYSVFGLSLRSNLAIPGLNSASTSLPATDVEVHLGISPATRSDSSTNPGELKFVSSDLNAAGEPALRIWHVGDSALLYLAYCDGMEFWLDRRGTSVWAKWPATSSLEDAATFLLGPVLGLLLRLRGVTCLHASAVAFDDRAVAFVGDEGAGKSTTAAAFARRGYPVLSDDVVAIVEREGGFYVMPAYPYLSLWPDSVKLLYGPDKSLPTFSANWDKRVLSLAEDRLSFQKKPLPLGAIFILGERSSEASAPFLEVPSAQDCLMALVANSYATGMLDTEMRSREFALFGRLLASVPVGQIRPHEEPAEIGKLCDAIRENYHRLSTHTLTPPPFN
jgi:hypothetical protein